MTRPSLEDRVAVCSWSLQPENPADLLAKLEAAGLRRVQLALDPLRETPEIWAQAPNLLRGHNITLASGMFGCVGEDYSTLDSIRLTGGIAPESTWAQNWRNIQATATLARQMGLELVTFHAGFLPHDGDDPRFAILSQRLRQIADLFQTTGLTLGLETGQETANALLHLLQGLGRTNLGVNFDPANMILYDKGDPIAALRLLGPWIRQVHIKDAVRTRLPGTWGQEVPAGTGEVDWPKFFAALGEIKFTGNLVIEREAGNQRVADIKAAKALVVRTAT